MPSLRVTLSSQRPTHLGPSTADFKITILIWLYVKAEATPWLTFDAQVRDLKATGAEKTFSEQISSIALRKELGALLSFVREGDVVLVTKLDRLARSVRDLMGIVDSLAQKQVALRILSMNMDTGTPTGKLMLTVLGGVAEFECDLMLERQREGIAKAKAEKKYKGRAPTA